MLVYMTQTSFQYAIAQISAGYTNNKILIYTMKRYRFGNSVNKICIPERKTRCLDGFFPANFSCFRHAIIIQFYLTMIEKYHCSKKFYK